MAQFHMNMKYISRSGGKSITAHAAYISGTCLQEDRTGLVFDYTKRQCAIISGIRAPEGTPEWLLDRQNLWNHVENFEDYIAETRFRGHKDPIKNAKSMAAKEKYLETCKTSYQATVGLPIEIERLDHLEELAIRIIDECYVKEGLIVDYGLHPEEGNPHLHIASTTRPLKGESFSQTRFVIEKEKVVEIRLDVAEIINEFAKEKGYNFSVDARSYKDRGIDIEASRHLGPKAFHKYKEKSQIGDENEEVRLKNIELLLQKPHEIVKLVASQKPVFTHEDIEREIFKRVGGDMNLFSLLKIKVDAGLEKDFGAELQFDAQVIQEHWRMMKAPEASNANTASNKSSIHSGDNASAAISEDSHIAAKSFGFFENVSLFVQRAFSSFLDRVHVNTNTNTTAPYESQEPIPVTSSELIQNLLEKANANREPLTSESLQDHEALVKRFTHDLLQSAGVALGQNLRGQEIFTTKEVVELEEHTKAVTQRLKEGTGKAIAADLQEAAIAKIEVQEKLSYSDEQRGAIAHLLDEKQIQILTGKAGTGKTTVLKPVVEAYKEAGYIPIGVAFQGKVSELLSTELGIPSFTLDQLRHHWKEREALISKLPELQGKALEKAELQIERKSQYLFTDKHVVILDEGNMVGGNLWKGLLDKVESSGAHLRVVQDQNQIKALYGLDISRLVEQEVGAYEIKEVFRQKTPWMRECSALLNEHKVEAGLTPYAENGHFTFRDTVESAKYAIVEAYIHDVQSRVAGTSDSPEELSNNLDKDTPSHSLQDAPMVLTFKTADVDDINAGIRSQLKALGYLGASTLSQERVNSLKAASNAGLKMLSHIAENWTSGEHYAKAQELGNAESLHHLMNTAHTRAQSENINLEKALDLSLTESLLQDKSHSTPEKLIQKAARIETIISEVKILTEGGEHSGLHHITKAAARQFQNIRGREYAVGDRVFFGDNDHTEYFVKVIEGEKGRGIKNGTLGIIEATDANKQFLSVRLSDGRLMGVDLKTYDALEYGYANTVNKAEGETYDRVLGFFDPLMDASKTLVWASRHKTDFRAFVSKTHGETIPELAVHVERADYRPLLGDFKITPENENPITLMRDYLKSSQEASHLWTVILKESQEEPFLHDAWPDFQAAQSERNRHAEEILTHWNQCAGFARQVGLKRSTLEIQAGLKDRILTTPEKDALARVEAYRVLASKARDLHEEKRTLTGDVTHLQDELTHVTALRDAISYEIATFPELHKPFFKVSQAEETFLSYAGEVYSRRPASWMSCERHAQSYINGQQDQFYIKTLSKSERAAYQELLEYKAYAHECGRLASLIKEDAEKTTGGEAQKAGDERSQSITQSQSDAQSLNLVKTQELKSALNEATKARDFLAYKIVTQFEGYEAHFERAKVSSTRLLDHAVRGEIRQEILKFERSESLDSYLSHGHKLYTLAYSHGALDKGTYAILRGENIDFRELAFAHGVFQDSHAKSLFETKDHARAAFARVRDYKETHRAVAQEWQKIKDTAISAIKAAQDEYCTLLGHETRQAIEDRIMTSLEIKDPTNIAVLRAVNQAVLANGKTRPLGEELMSHRSTLLHMESRLRRGRSGFIDIYREGTGPSQGTAFGALRDQRIDLAGQILKVSGNVIEVAFNSHQKMFEKDISEYQAKEQVAHYRSSPGETKAELASSLLEQVKARDWTLKAQLSNQGVSQEELRLYEFSKSLTGDGKDHIQSYAALEEYIKARNLFSSHWEPRALLVEKAIALHNERYHALEDATLQVFKAQGSKINVDLKATQDVIDRHVEIGSQAKDPEAFKDQLPESLRHDAKALGIELSHESTQEIAGKIGELIQLKSEIHETRLKTMKSMKLDSDSAFFAAASARNETAWHLMKSPLGEKIKESNIMFAVEGYAARHDKARIRLERRKAEKDIESQEAKSQQLRDAVLQIYKDHTSKDISDSKALLAAIDRHVEFRFQSQDREAYDSQLPETLTHEAKSLGIALSDESAKAIAEKIQELTQLKTQIQGAQVRFAKFKDANNWDGKASDRDAKDNPRFDQSNKPYIKAEEVEAALSQDMTRFADHIFSSLGIQHHRGSSSATERRFGKNGHIAVNLKTGAWIDHKDSSLTGGPLSLLTKLKGMDYREAIEYGAAWAGISGETRTLAQSTKPIQPQSTNTDIKDHEARIQKAKDLWEKAQPIEGTVAERYLREHRKIAGTLPQDLRYLSPQRQQGESTAQNPAGLVVAARDTKGEIQAVQVTYLDPRTAQKAEIDVKKRSFGVLKGSAVTLQDDKDHTNTNTLYVAEGVETALSLKAAGVKGTILASLGLSNIKRLSPTPGTKIIVCADHDAPDSPALKTLNNAVSHLKEQGHDVYVIKPQTQDHDFNDVLKIHGITGVREELTRQLPEDLKSNAIFKDAHDHASVEEKPFRLTKEQEKVINRKLDLGEKLTPEEETLWQRVVDQYEKKYGKEHSVAKESVQAKEESRFRLTREQEITINRKLDLGQKLTPEEQSLWDKVVEQYEKDEKQAMKTGQSRSIVKEEPFRLTKEQEKVINRKLDLGEKLTPEEQGLWNKVIEQYEKKLKNNQWNGVQNRERIDMHNTHEHHHEDLSQQLTEETTKKRGRGIRL